jgi:SAM-dependent methyltransferase
VSVEASTGQVWEQGDVYERYVGRWSALVAEEFVQWIDAPDGARWLDVGCGTGALGSRILERAHPATLAGIDSSATFVEVARLRLGKAFEPHVGDAATLPFTDREFDVVVSGLLLNFLPDPVRALAEQRRVSRGTVAAYVWDYAERMEVIRFFWDAARELSEDAAALDEAVRFPLAQEHALRRLFAEAGLAENETRAIEVRTVFSDFDDLWSPFLGGQGPAPAYAAALDPQARDALRERLRARLDVAEDGTIELVARAWAVKARVSDRDG